MKQNLEVYSNIAYLIVGAIGLYLDVWLIGVSLIILGLASAFSHETRIWWPDWLAMWLVFSCIIVESLPLGTSDSIIVSLVLGALLNTLGTILKYTQIKLFGLKMNFILLGIVFLVGVLLLDVRSLDKAICISIFAFAFLVRSVNHSLWHVIGSVGFGYLIWAIWSI